MRAALIAVLAALGLAAPAQASMVFERGTNTLAVYIAGDDGSGAHRLAAGSGPVISPDGQHVVYTVDGDTDHPVLNEIAAAGGAPSAILPQVSFGVLVWSHDGRYLAATAGKLNEPQSLVLIDMTTATSRTVDSGFFTGASFSPDGSALVYGRGPHDAGARDLYTAPTAGGPALRITHDGKSEFPLWGAKTIAYDRLNTRSRFGPTTNLGLINPDGSGAKALTHDKIPRLLFGLVPIAWSADGTRLLANYGGQDTSYIVTVNPASGKEHVIGAKFKGYQAAALSADGRTILATTGGAIFGSRSDIVTVPYAGGRFTTLTRGASPGWNR